MDIAKVPRYDYEVHHLAELFPDLPPDEYSKLLKDIELHGQIEPVMLSADGETLLDGRTRMKVCKQLSIVPRIERFDAKAGQSDADFIWARNVLRRHLTDDQRAALSRRWSDAERAAAKERQKAGLRKGDQTPVVADSPQRGKTRKTIAAKAHVSEHKIRQVDTVAKHRPELLPKVESGAMTLKDAHKEAMSTDDEAGHVRSKPNGRDTSSPQVEPTPAETSGRWGLIGLESLPHRISLFVKQNGPRDRREWFYQGAKLFATELPVHLKRHGLWPLFDREGNEITFEVKRDAVYVQRKPKP